MIFKKMFVLVIFTSILFTVSGFSKVSNHEILFEKAKFTMETEGDLKEAIKLFQKIINEYPAQKKFAAKSQLNIAICKEKLGMKEARKAYRKVINNYPAFQQEVLIARKRLSRLVNFSAKKSKETGALEKDNGDIILKQVWAKPLDDMGSPSPDGRYISFVHWNKAQLGIYEIATGKITELPKTAGIWEKTSRWPESPIWSPDGKQLAYVWYDYPPQNKNEQTRSIAIRIAGLDGTGPRELYTVKSHSYPHPFSWSQDGRFILAMVWRPKNLEMIMISVKDGSIKSVNKWERDSGVSAPRISPDGKYVTFERSPDPDSPQKDIHLLSLNGSIETILIKHPATDFCPFWSPDGKNIIFFSNRSGLVGVWIQKIKNGKAIGEPKLAKNLNRISPMGITDNGNLFMTFPEGGYNIYSMEIDPETGKVISPPKRAVESNVGWNGASSFSKDGNYMAYISQRGLLPWQTNWGQESLIIRNLNSGEERELIPKLKTMRNGPRAQLQWSPDGREILINGRNKLGNMGQYIVDVSNGKITRSFVRGSDDSWEPVWSKDGANLFFYRAGNAEYSGVYRVNRASGKETILCNEKNVHELALHPDGDTLAVVVDKHGIKLISTLDGKIRELLKMDPKNVSAWRMSIAWSPDGKWLYFRKWINKTKGSELWRVSSDGNRVEDLKISFPQISFISIHPDGKRLTFTNSPATSAGVESSIWVLKNFLKEK